MLSTAHYDNSIKQTNIDLRCELQSVMFQYMYFCIPQALPSYLTNDDLWSPTDIRLQRKWERKEFPIHHIVWKQVQNTDLMNEISISRKRRLNLIMNLQILYFTQCTYGLSLFISSKTSPCSWSLASLPWTERNYLQGAIKYDLKHGNKTPSQLSCLCVSFLYFISQ